MKLPACSISPYSTDYGDDFDCEALHDEACEDCLCNYKNLGGLWHPVTGKRVPLIMALILYGPITLEQAKEGV